MLGATCIEAVLDARCQRHNPAVNGIVRPQRSELLDQQYTENGKKKSLLALD
jgi:hypothetical protein